SRFNYSICNPPATLSAAGKIIGSINAPLAVMDNPLVDFIDLNGDGLPDIIKTVSGGGAHKVAFNLGETNTGFGKSILWSSPVQVASADGLAWNIDLESGGQPGQNIAHLADMDGDGLADLVYLSPFDTVYYFKNQARLGWSNRVAMATTDIT